MNQTQLSHIAFIKQQVARLQLEPNALHTRYLVVPQRYREFAITKLAQTPLVNVLVTTKKHFFSSLMEKINPFETTYMMSDELTLYCLEWLLETCQNHPFVKDKNHLMTLAQKLAKQVEEWQMQQTTFSDEITDQYLKLKVDLFESIYQQAKNIDTYPMLLEQLLQYDLPEIELIMSHEQELTKLETAVISKIKKVVQNDLSQYVFDFAQKPNLKVVAATYDRLEIEFVFAKIMAYYEQGISLDQFQIVCSNDQLLQKVIQQANKYQIPLTYEYNRPINHYFKLAELTTLATISDYILQIQTLHPTPTAMQKALLNGLSNVATIILQPLNLTQFVDVLTFIGEKINLEVIQNQGVLVTKMMQEQVLPYTFLIGVDETQFIKPMQDQAYFSLMDRKQIKSLPNQIGAHNYLWQTYLADLFLNDYQMLYLCYSTVDLLGTQYHVSPLLSHITPQLVQESLIVLEKFDMQALKTQARQLQTSPYIQPLKSSVSSLETFYGCPYQYFIKYGLKIPYYRKKTIDALYIGSLFHDQLAYNLLTSQTKTPPTKQQVKDLISAYFLQNETNESSAYKQLVLNLLSDHFHQILGICFEQLYKGDYQIEQVEQAFEISLKQLVDDLPYDVIFRGSIDRIDQNNNYIRIIDYKTGPKMIDYDELYVGLSLQLPMYAIIANYLYQKPVSFMGYEVVNAQFETLKTSSDAFVSLEKWKRNYQLRGLVLDEEMAILSQDEALFILPGNISSDVVAVKGKSKTKQTYSGAALIEAQSLQAIYVHTLEKVKEATSRILAGDIAITPFEKRCGYCDYKMVCGFDEQLHDIKPIKDPNETFKKALKGGVDNG